MSVLRFLSAVAFATVVTAQATGGGCTNGTYILPSTTGAGYTCVTACPPRMFDYSNYCVTQCPNGTMPVNSTCTLLASPSPKPVACPGAATGECSCNFTTSWLVRNPNAPPLIACVPKNDTTLPPISCGSFTAGLVFAPDLKDCRCNPIVPYLSYNQADPIFSYACTNLTTGAYPIRCANATDYFSILLGKCTPARPFESPSVSASPSASASATGSPIPAADNYPTPEVSVSPNPTPDASASVKPSDRPTPRPSNQTKPSERPTPEAFATVKPSDRPTPRPSEQVKPTQMPSVPISRRSALPTPRTPRSPPPSQRPIAIQNTLRLPGGTLPNSTDTSADEAIQRFQAALACSHRLPPEQIRIRNVTVTNAAGAIWTPPLPAPLSTNGTVVCYNATVSSGLAASLRALSTSDIGVAVEYTIEGDAATAALLTPEDLTSTLVNSAMMVEVAASVGATGIAASTTDVSYGAAATAPATPTTNSATNNSPIVMIVSGVGAALVAVVIVSAMVILGIIYTRKPSDRPQQPAAAARRTVIIVEQAPQGTSVMNPMADRVTFAPTQRSRV